MPTRYLFEEVVTIFEYNKCVYIDKLRHYKYI